MIALRRPSQPPELTPQLQTELVAKYLASNEPVWDLLFLRRALLAMSYGKCVYCECRLTEESKYIEVEHFHPKSRYPHEVVTWDNLLAACKRCNGSKRDHDPRHAPIINPTSDDPKAHLVLKDYRLRAKDPLGQLTIEVLNLNDHDRVVTPRFRVGEAVQDLLEDVLALAAEYVAGTNVSVKRRSQILNRVRALLREAGPSAEYSSTTATILLRDPAFTTLKGLLLSAGLWDDELESLEQQANTCCLGA